MKIALTGMPGSGKSALAEKLQDVTGSAEIIDGYPTWVEDEIDLVKGLDGGGYIYNLAIALKRVALERVSKHAEKPEHTITCGTLLDTSVYTALEFELYGELQSSDDQIDEVRRVEATLKTLACLYMDTFHYDAVFYLPPVEEVTERQWELFDRYLRTSFEAFFLVPVIPLTAEGADLNEITEKRAELVAAVMNGEVTVESLTERAGTQA